MSLFFVDKEEMIMFEEDIYENMSVKEMLADISRKGLDDWSKDYSKLEGIVRIADDSFYTVPLKENALYEEAFMVPGCYKVATHHCI